MAQDRGIVETDPTNDLEGRDSQAKILILANVLMAGELKLNDINYIGISNIKTDKVVSTRENGKRLKLISEAWRDTDGCINAEVSLKEVTYNDPLYSVHDTSNGLLLFTDLLGSIYIAGPGAGGTEAGYALLSDLLEIHRSRIME
jgi:homoserine dehydrogenase